MARQLAKRAKAQASLSELTFCYTVNLLQLLQEFSWFVVHGASSHFVFCKPTERSETHLEFVCLPSV